MRKPIKQSAIWSIGYILFLLIYPNNFDYIAQAQVAPLQVENNNIWYGVSRAMIRQNVVITFVTISFIVSLAVIWIGWLLRRQENGKLPKSSSLLLLLALGVGILPGCKPYGATQVLEIKPNETAFVVPLVGDATTQAQFQSIEFLEQRQVAAKQVEIPMREHKIGRMYWDIEWIPTVAVIIVDRTPVTREWTSASSTGTSNSNQAFGVESSESIDFKVGATCSALVEEQYAAKFLYYFSGKSLPEVMDENIRGFVQAELFKEFGSRTLAQGREDKKMIFEAVFERTKEQFQPLGISITSLGGSEGLIYTDDNVQKVINDNFAAQQRQVQVAAQATAQAIENETLVNQAHAAATATVMAGEAAAEVLRASGEQLSLHPGLTDYELANRSTGQVPHTLIISGSGQNVPLAFLMNMDGNDAGPIVATAVPSPTPSPTPSP